MQREGAKAGVIGGWGGARRDVCSELVEAGRVFEGLHGDRGGWHVRREAGEFAAGLEDGLRAGPLRIRALHDLRTCGTFICARQLRIALV